MATIEQANADLMKVLDPDDSFYKPVDRETIAAYRACHQRIMACHQAMVAALPDEAAA
jgi:hypothetical protein